MVTIDNVKNIILNHFQGQEVNLILNTDDLILNAYPKEETEEEPSLTFTLEKH